MPEGQCDNCLGEGTELMDVSGQHWCPVCINEDASRCDRCGHWVVDEEIVAIISGVNHPRYENWCDACRSSYAWSCHCCEESFSDNLGSTVTYNGDLCQGCYENHYFTCVLCGEVHHIDHRDDDGCCEDCEVEADEDEEAALILPYHGCNVAKELGKLGSPKDRLWYGVELEVTVTDVAATAEAVVERLGDHFVKLQQDSSIAGTGFEIITAPATLAIQYEQWDKLFVDPIAGMYSWKTGSCGMHVHVSREPFTALHIGKLLVLLNDPDNRQLVATIAGRYGNGFCIPVPEKSVKDNQESGRYELLNLCNRNTIEFRLFRGTLHKQHFYANLEFCAATIAYSKLCSLRDLTQATFLAWLAKDGTYKNLQGYLAAKGLVETPKKRKDPNVPDTEENS